MRDSGKQTLFTLIFCLVSFGVFPQAKFTVIPPTDAEAGQRFHVVFRLENGDANAPKISEINGCKFISGPGTSTSYSMSFINGQQSSKRTIDFTYTYRADSAGTYTIPSASISVDGKTLKTQPTTFKVFPSNSPKAPGSPGKSNFSPLQEEERLSSKDVFIKMIPSKTTVFEQEPIECSVILYTKYREIESVSSQSRPNFDGCLIEDIPIGTPKLDNVEEVNGQAYSTAVLQKVIIFPQKTGKLTLNSGKYDITVAKFERVQTFFGTQIYPVGSEEVHVNPGDLTITVKPLPEDGSGYFNGAVGTFNVQSRLSNDKLRTNEAATLTFTISGSGNIRYLKEPEIEFPAEFEVYPVKSETDARVSGGNVAGVQTFEYTFVPQAPGTFTIAGGEFVYFNPSSGQYVSIPTPSYKIEVGKGAGVSASGSQKQMKLDGGMTDILHIKPGVTGLGKEHSLMIYSWIYWCFWIILIIVTVLYVTMNKWSSKRNADVAGRRLAKAGKVARKRLRKARSVMGASDGGSLFYDELVKAIWGYLSDKLTIPASQLSRHNIADRLKDKNVSEEVINRTIELLDRCEMARYTPGSDEQSSMNEMLQDTETVMADLQKVK